MIYESNSEKRQISCLNGHNEGKDGILTCQNGATTAKGSCLFSCHSQSCDFWKSHKCQSSRLFKRTPPVVSEGIILGKECKVGFNSIRRAASSFIAITIRMSAPFLVTVAYSIEFTFRNSNRSFSFKLLITPVRTNSIS